MRQSALPLCDLAVNLNISRSSSTGSLGWVTGSGQERDGDNEQALKTPEKGSLIDALMVIIHLLELDGGPIWTDAASGSDMKR